MVKTCRRPACKPSLKHEKFNEIWTLLRIRLVEQISCSQEVTEQ